MIGTKLGPYEITAKLGEGGMGEVWRARDTKLERDVAIKVLPVAFVTDHERLSRFEREAKLLAQLNHPGIAHIYGIEASGAAHALVMELVEGPTLAERLAAGPIPLDEMLGIARQMADALEAAHDRGIVHRDLKPQNVKLTADGAVKVLDFGLAKAMDPADAFSGTGGDAARSPTLMNSPTLTAAGTQLGVILGTAAYMAPEQARGGAVDKRADVWAFGVVLFEMLTGSRLFAEDTVSDTLAGVLKSEIDLARLPESTPPAIRRLLRRCLARNPKHRLHDIADARIVIDDVLAGVAADPPTVSAGAAAHGTSRRSVLAVAAAAALVTLVAGVLIGRRVAAPTAPSPAGTAAAFQRLTFRQGEEVEPALSPDGKSLYFVAPGAGGDDDIWFVPVGGRKPIDLTADSPADDGYPAVSPDGHQIAFRSDRDGGGIFLMGTTGESVRRLADGCFDPAWAPDGTSLACTTCDEGDPFARGCRGELRIVEVGTGKSRTIPTGDVAAPAWSPDGRSLVYWGLAATDSGWRDLYVVGAEGGQPAQLTTDAAVDWNPLWSDDGSAIYFLSDRGGSPNLWRLALDSSRRAAAGAPRSVVLPTEFAATVRKNGGRWVFVSRSLRAAIGEWSLGASRPAVAATARPVLSTVGSIFSFAVSPDGKSVAYSTLFPRQDLFVVPIEGGSPVQLTDDVAIDRFPSWDPDGKRILFMSNRSGRYEFWAIRADGGGLEQLTTFGVGRWRPRLSPDRRRLSADSQNGTDIFDVSGAPPWERFEPLNDPANPSSSKFEGFVWSHDGERLAGRLRGGPLAIWSFRERRLRILAARGQPVAWEPGDRQLLAESFSATGKISGLLWLDPETGKTLPVDSAAVAGWSDVVANLSTHTLLGYRNDVESDIWLAEGLE